ncbi:MAG TPA: flagellar biosynthesis protein FlhF, partial [Rubrivivax sp.]|nr:flagellar biosynthesis protein FlhF [Rubrivivax sp.]
MNLKRFTARTARDALALVRQAFGDDAVVMSTKPCAEGVEVLAMAPESVQQLERVGAAAAAECVEPRLPDGVEQDVEQLQMSTLSFQDYVRQRMLKRRRTELAGGTPAAEAPPPALPVTAPIEAARARHGAAHRNAPVLREEVPMPPTGAAAVASAAVVGRGEPIEILSELRSMRGLIEQRFGALAFMDRLQR